MKKNKYFCRPCKKKTKHSKGQVAQCKKCGTLNHQCNEGTLSLNNVEE